MVPVNDDLEGYENVTYVEGSIAEEEPYTPSTSVPSEESATVTDDLSLKEEPSGCCIRLASGCRNLNEQLREPVQELSMKGKHWIKKSMTIRNLKDAFPITKWLPKYRLKYFQGDLIAGLTVALTVIPQGLAYAQVAELPPQYGLYSAFMGCLVYMVLGTSKDIAVGPTAIMSLLTAEFGRSPIEHDPTYAILLSFFVGIIQMLMGVVHIGFVVDYISHPVINSFCTAAAITIAWSQVKKWLGLQKIPRDFLNEVYWDFKKIPETKLYDFLMGLSCLLALYGMKKLREVKWGKSGKMCPVKRVIKYVVWLSTTSRNAIIVVLSSGVSAIFLGYQLKPFAVTGTITSGLPPFRVPDFTITVGNDTQSTMEILRKIGTGFFIIPILGIVEAIAIGKAFARKNNYDINSNQELLAFGASNFLGAFVGAFPVTGSFSRTAVNAQSGVKTQAGAIWTAALVLLALAFLTPLFYYIPDAALAAVIIMAVIDMIDFSLLKKLWRVKKIDLIPWIVTFICSLVLGVEWGVIIGVGVSLIFLLYPWSRPQFHTNSLKNDEAIVVTVNQGLLFPGIEYFKDKVYSKTNSDDGTKSVVMDFSNIANADFTVVEGLHQLLEDFAKKNRKLIICNLRPDILDVFLRAKLKHFQHAATVEEAISLLQGHTVVLPVPMTKMEKEEEEEVEETRSIQHSSSYDDEEEADEEEDETPDINYIVSVL